MIDSEHYPDDPLSMPPPYWDDSGALDQFIRSMEMVEALLPGLSEEGDRISPLVDSYHERKEKEGIDYDTDYEEFGVISDDFMNIEHAIASYADLCVLMGGISAETLLNKFCVYNFHKDISDPLETLSMPDKFIIASALAGSPGVKSTAPYEAIKQLSRKRNAFAHGHCVYRPTSSMRKNHLRNEQSGIQNAKKSVENLVAAVNWYLSVHDYLCKITRNKYVVGVDDSRDTGRIREILQKIRSYSFLGIDEYFPYEIVNENDLEKE